MLFSFRLLLALAGALCLSLSVAQAQQHTPMRDGVASALVHADGPAKASKKRAKARLEPRRGEVATQSASPATVRFTLYAPARVSLTVYDVMGRAVAIPIRAQYRGAGLHEVHLGEAALPSGIYVVDLEAGPSRLRQRLTVGIPAE